MMSSGISVLFVMAISTIIVDAAPAVEDGNKAYLVPYLGKKYELSYSDDKFDDVMKALGVSFLKRNMGKLAKPVMELTEKDGRYTLSSVSSFKDYAVTFKIGEEFQHLTPDDRSVKCKFTQDKNKLIQIENGEKNLVVEREFSDDEVVVTTKIDDIVSIRKYKRV